MAIDKETNENIKTISSEEKKGIEGANAPAFSKGLYDWLMFLLAYYSRIRENLKIDFETFIILQVVVSHSLYHLNKDGVKKFTEIQKNFDLMSMSNLSKINKLAFASIAEVLHYQEKLFVEKYYSLKKKK